MDRTAFFKAVRSSLFAGKMSASQVKGTEAILDEAARRGTRLEWLAYMLATAFHETAHTMQPVRETLSSTDDKAIRILDRAFAAGQLSWVKTPYWRKDKDGKSWLGRGLVQLTHKSNYQTMSPIVGADLVADPGRAMDTNVAVKIMFEGMERGSFTGKKLSDYIGASVADYKNARRIINGTESAGKVASHARLVEAALRAAGYSAKVTLPARDEKPSTPAPVPDREVKPAKTGLLAAIINALVALLKGTKK